jgi:hypothetical protein
MTELLDPDSIARSGLDRGYVRTAGSRVRSLLPGWGLVTTVTRGATVDGNQVAFSQATAVRGAVEPSTARRSARSYGRSMRSACIGLGVLATLSACTDDDLRDADGTVVTAGTASVFELRAGDCLAPAPELTGEVAELPLVPCDEEHTQEVFGIVAHPDDSYPGAEAVAAWADGACLTELERTLDLTLDDGVFVSYLLPTFDGWNTNDDRDVTCVLVFPGQDAMTGSFVAGTADIRRVEPLPPVPDVDEADPDGALTTDDPSGA